MRVVHIISALIFISLTFLISACSEQAEKKPVITDSHQHVNAQELAHVKDDELNHELELTVYKDKNCGCCKKWLEHLNQSAIKTKAVDIDDMAQIKAKYQIQPNQRSCHTAVSAEGFVFEGHVPAKFIKQFLAEKHQPDVLGLTVPAMPVGSPGMEVRDLFHKYKIEQLSSTASNQLYKEINHYDEQF